MSILLILSLSIVVLIILSYSLLLVLSPPPIKYASVEHTFISSRDPNRQTQQLPSLDDVATLDLSVIIPAYNEESRLPPMLLVTLRHLLSIKPSRSFEILVVDDGSKDKTIEAALSTSIPGLDPDIEIRAVRLIYNKGKGAAVKHGFLHARGRRILMVDADGASKFADLELLWEEMDRIEVDGHAISVGSRAHLVGTEAVVKRSFIRNLLMHGLHFCLRTLGVGHIHDTQCGFKLFSRDAARLLFPTMHISHWIFDVELLLLARLLHIPTAEVPIAWHEVEGSKINLISDSIGMLRDLVVLRANYAFGRWKIIPRTKIE